MPEDTTNLDHALQAMLNNDRVRFRDYVSDALRQKAANAITDRTAELQGNMLRKSGEEAPEVPDEADFPASEITGAEAPEDAELASNEEEIDNSEVEPEVELETEETELDAILDTLSDDDLDAFIDMFDQIKDFEEEADITEIVEAAGKRSTELGIAIKDAWHTRKKLNRDAKKALGGSHLDPGTKNAENRLGKNLGAYIDKREKVNKLVKGKNA